MLDVQNDLQSANYTFGPVDIHSIAKPPANFEEINMVPPSGFDRFHSSSQPTSPSHLQQHFFHNPPPTSSLPVIRAVHVTPTVGMANSQIKVVINVQPHPAMPIRSFRVVFGSTDATTRVAFENRASAVERVELLATAPRLNSIVQTGTIPLMVQAVDANEVVLASADAGLFEFVDRKSSPLSSDHDYINDSTNQLWHTPSPPQIHQENAMASLFRPSGILPQDRQVSLKLRLCMHIPFIPYQQLSISQPSHPQCTTRPTSHRHTSRL